jgi:osmoprotectant transport system permease protein
LEGSLDEPTVRRLNARVKAGESQARVAADFLRDKLGVSVEAAEEPAAVRVARRTAEHLALVAAGLTPAVLVGVPLGVFAFRRPRAGRLVVGAAGLIQTIPSLALLMFLLAVPPSLGGGLGFTPAAVALFLYALLPIVRNTATGLSDIPPSLREAADGLGLTGWQKLRLVELPLAARAILAGVKTSAVITIGTATLGAFIDAGGLGMPIREGLVNNDLGRIFQGAVPATLLALAAEGAFDLLERAVVPRGLRLKRN